MSSVFIFFKQLPAVVYFKSLPPPIKMTTYAYVIGLLSYNAVTEYSESKTALNVCHSKRYPEFKDKYNGEYSYDEYSYDEDNQKKYYEQLKTCTTDWDAAKLGASYFKWERLWNSIVFPITMVSYIVPSIVIALHGKKE